MKMCLCCVLLWSSPVGGRASELNRSFTWRYTHKMKALREREARWLSSEGWQSTRVFESRISDWRWFKRHIKTLTCFFRRWSKDEEEGSQLRLATAAISDWKASPTCLKMLKVSFVSSNKKSLLLGQKQIVSWRCSNAQIDFQIVRVFAGRSQFPSFEAFHA